MSWSVLGCMASRMLTSSLHLRATTANAGVAYACPLDARRVVEIPAVHDGRVPHLGGNTAEVRRAVHQPFGHDREHVGTGEHRVWIVRQRHALAVTIPHGRHC